MTPRKTYAAVRVDSGPVTPTQFVRDVSPEKWAELVKKRRDYLDDQIYSDCRCLVRFVQEAEEMWEAMGYRGIADLVQNGYGLEPEEVLLAVRWLEINDPDTPISLPEVTRLQGLAGQAEPARSHAEAMREVATAKPRSEAGAFVKAEPAKGSDAPAPAKPSPNVSWVPRQGAADPLAGRLRGRVATLEGGYSRSGRTAPLPPAAGRALRLSWPGLTPLPAEPALVP